MLPAAGWAAVGGLRSAPGRARRGRGGFRAGSAPEPPPGRGNSGRKTMSGPRRAHGHRPPPRVPPTPPEQKPELKPKPSARGRGGGSTRGCCVWLSAVSGIGCPERTGVPAELGAPGRGARPLVLRGCARGAGVSGPLTPASPEHPDPPAPPRRGSQALPGTPSSPHPTCWGDLQAVWAGFRRGPSSQAGLFLEQEKRVNQSPPF